MEAIISIERAFVSYRETLALHDISLAVNDGEFVGIIGPNGAGKTTLLTLVNGFTKASGGSVTVLGKPVNGSGRHELRKQVGYVAQITAIDRRMPATVRDVVMMGRYGVLGLFHRPGENDKKIVENAISMVGLSLLTDRPIGNLSGGEQQRVSIARCLAQEPKIFLLDEPTAALDWKAQSEILELVHRIHDEKHLTTLFVTHDMDALPHTCDRVILMKNGTVVADGPPDKLISTASLSRLYGLPEDVVGERQPHVHPHTHHHRGEV
ncbi:MAG TPA: metal ABC transporter ATP-binding protein [Dehalococcoidales bacterium]|nr:metal ABC transporter ATP-binding protein [Dehalococcoidales bacterium]